ncbi:MAG: hypothetical protein ACKV2V_28370 [Blastocatellia bacterium]
MNNPPTLIAALAGAPEIMIGLVREAPPQILRRRPGPHKWSAHEHPCYITTADAPYLERLELMLADPSPRITPMFPSPEEEAGGLLNVDLDKALALYVRERARLSRLAKDGGARRVQSLLRLDHVPATTAAREADVRRLINSPQVDHPVL